MNDGLKMLETMVGAQLAKEPLPTPDRIRELIGQIRQIPLCADVSDEQAEALARSLENSHGVSMKIGSMLTGRDYVPWLDAARAHITPYYWNRYRQLLAEQGFSGDVLVTLDDVTDRILNLLENPAKTESWDRRGMVVGHVQSGKTANYTGLICKAADAGYRLIIVIAGIHNNLRNQTQMRIDEGFVGRDSARLLSNRDDPAQRFIGVGRFNKSRRPVTFTNSIKDFSKTLASSVGVPLDNLREPAIFVIKKNSSTLKNLISWLQEHNQRAGTSVIDAPMLLIDDEADNASINTAKGSDEATRINGQIRTLLKLFDHSCYVGYTATPFANIFIDPDSETEMLGEDLFPRDFIVSLDPPTNYFGANRVFLEDSEAILRPITDNGDLLPLKHKKDFTVTALPASLEKAVRTFVVARAIRLARGQRRKHCSMLVNASRFTDVQRQLRNEVHALVDRIRASVRVNGALPQAKALQDGEIAALHAAWLEEFAPGSEFGWQDIQPLLLESIAPVSVVEVNSRSSGNLNYSDHEEHGLNVIAVGGFSLSRGLTLEGLTVSYFLRNSMMYDTLMQMGRWFGYRQGYDDLCRVWMPEEAEGWYAHIAESIEELRDELRSMAAVPGATPEQFGLKVRSHPDTLIVTARNKMGSGEKLVVSIGLANKFAETAILKRDADSLRANRNAAVALAKALAAAGRPLSSASEVTGGFLLRDAPVGPVRDFIASFVNHPGSLLTVSAPVCQHIDDRAASELASWDVLFASLKKREDKGLSDASLGITINCPRRGEGDRSRNDPTTLRVTNKQRVTSRGVEKTGLTDEQVEEAEREYRERDDSRPAKDGGWNYPDRIYRAKRERPLLIVHMLAIGKEGDDLRQAEPVVAWSISFPGTALEEKKVTYVVNTTWVRENFSEDLEEEEMGGDDDR
ncbi:MAG: Z1 domain-containing protein [Phenylobacterium sp.]|uniref:Z1 domain-containing protein n=1 Tax=Phenylobacterium sp. TaxID=1871053 RepID=UPI0025DC777D|nr:Z1 domain-containing protein [Phenylobacterium sp.]MCA3730107.1 Z1 domain-containing protein [Phenylobacterium sp.]MCA3746384.1 Z1 domain-containing protein [Phenylobacterium sp.]MCA4915481.1 Z1 domain-containing protein [Phenylobacterium sp.]MCA6284447.1 Z1 domain-containing protein [Phenylobacterium sp.]